MTEDAAGRSDDPGVLATTLEGDDAEGATPRERAAALLERRLDPFMAVLAVLWGLYLGYELVAPPGQRPVLTLVSNIVWGIFVLEFVVKLAVSGAPLRFLRRRWPSVLFLVLPALRVLRVLRTVRTLRLLPAARVLGASYRAVGTARGLLQGRIAFLAVTTVVVVVSGGQLLYVLEANRDGAVSSLGEAMWWSANLSVSSTLVLEPVTTLGRLLALVLSAYALVVFASLAGTVGAFFVESRQERAVAESPPSGPTRA